VELLPLSRRDLVVAKLQGRLAAGLIQAAAGYAVLLLAWWLMLQWDLVERPPSLLDPWIIGSGFIFAALFVGSNRAAWVERLHSFSAAANCRGAMVMQAGLVILAWYLAGVIPRDPRAYALVPLAALLGVLWHVATPPALPAPRRGGWYRLLTRPLGDLLRLSPDRTWARWLARGFRTYWAAAVVEVGQPARPGLSYSQGHLPLMLAFFAVITGAGLCILALGLLWTTANHALGHPSGDVLWVAGGFATVLPLILFAVLIFGVSFNVWQDLSTSPARLRQSRNQRSFVPAHTGLLLPEAPQRRWWRRLATYVVTALALGAAGSASHWVCWTAAGAVCGGPRDLVGPRGWLAYGLAFVPGLGLFAWLPLLRHAARVIRLSGMALMGLAYLGFILGPLASVPVTVGLTLHGGEYLRALVGGASVAGAVGVILGALLLSWRWADPASWTRDADGSPSARSAIRAGLIVGVIPVACALTIAAIPVALSLLR